jgi:hypothetical protein
LIFDLLPELDNISEYYQSEEVQQMASSTPENEENSVSSQQILSMVAEIKTKITTRDPSWTQGGKRNKKSNARWIVTALLNFFPLQEKTIDTTKRQQNPQIIQNMSQIFGRY